MSSEPPPPPRALELLYPFYLDSDMSMAFAAALAGGVALEAEQVDRSDQTSQAVKNLRGNLRAFSALGVEGGREASEGSTAATESRLIRRHTDASIFIDLYDELRRTGRLIEDPKLDELSTGSIVSTHMGPAVAPLRRVVDQVIRLLDLTMPVLAEEPDDAPSTPQGSKSQRKRQSQRAGGQQQTGSEADEGLRELRQVHRLFVALRDDLERSGMIDIAVAREDAPSAVITLDKRFVSDPAVELLHTSAFTIVGKVTNVWRSEDEIANLYRRSVVSLLPSLAQTVTWGLLAMLGSLASGLNPAEMEKLAYTAAGVSPAVPAVSGDEADDAGDQAETAESEDGSAAQGEQSAELANGGQAAAGGGNESTEDAEETTDGVLFGEELLGALNPVVAGPAFQILPLAICS